ncbi:MAG: flippase-like domain-containing protein [Anaerolineae bacterium]|nr:flippase-like domain-containing protein [Anaerolineae bacterium]
MSRWRLWLIGGVVSLLAIYFIVSQINVAVVWEALRGARWIYVLPSALLLLVGLFTRAIRWRILLQGGLPLMRAFHILNVSYLVNGVLPLRLGEVARAYLAWRADDRVGIPRALGTIVVERVLDLLSVLGLIALAASVALPPELRAAAFSIAPLSFAGLIALALAAARRAWVLRLIETISARIGFLARLNLTQHAEDFLKGLAPLAQPAAFAGAVGWTMISWICSVAAGYVLMLAFYDTASWAASALFIGAASLAIAVPAVPGNVGTYEASILLALGALGYGQPVETATAFALVVHGLNLLLYAIMGAIGLAREGVTLAQLSREVGEMRG